MPRKISLFIIFFIFSIAFCFADSSKDAFYHLKDGAGARAFGMGGAFVTLADDSFGTYWNPACLSELIPRYTDISGTYTVFAPDSSSGFISISQFVEESKGGIGVSYHTFTDGELKDNDIPFENREHVITVAYGIKPTMYFSLGAAVKYYWQMLKQGKKDSFGFDIGMLYQFPDTSVKVAVVAQDLTSALTDATLRGGMSYEIVNNVLILSGDAEKTIGKKTRFHFGAEIKIIKEFALRMGLNDFDAAAGFGVNYSGYKFDYAYTDNKGSLLYTHSFSLSILF